MVTEDCSDRYILTTIEMTVLHVHTETLLNPEKLKLRAWSFFIKEMCLCNMQQLKIIMVMIM
nr:hypothetical protein LBZUJACN_LBZUJACN_CDS_0016 [Caudoviricetes sp.]CAI9750976.1 hypothetical protein MIHLRAQX_MIHLRAQX_CDS_0016 [Caudoviricetes sp.]